jgi:hypothetical protein
MAHPTLTRARVLRVSRLLRAQGRKLPKMGYCVTVREAKGDVYSRTYMGNYKVELCRDRGGLYALPPDTDGLFGARRRKSRARRR